MKKTAHFSAAVFAGGASTRMGTDKAFVRFGDESLIERQLRCLQDAGAAEILISGRAGVDYSPFGLPVVHDEYPDAGPLAGLIAVLKKSTFRKTLILAVDMPAMTSAMLRKIVSQSGDDQGCVPVNDRGFEPLAAAYSRQQLPLAEELITLGKYSMRKFVEQAVSRGLALTLQIEPAERIHFTNCNGPSDWADFRNPVGPFRAGTNARRLGD